MKNKQVTVLVPAHNEANGIGQTLKTLLPQLTPQDRIIVVADNCTDETAAIASKFGVTVLERHNSERLGKGYALDYGLQFIQADPPDVVVIVDADCHIEPGSLHKITHLAHISGQPVQATYLMNQPDHPNLKDKISMFALQVKNLVRLKGLKRLQYHCLLTGSGMAFPWSAIKEVSLAGSKTTDDMQLTVDLALAGYSPIFCQDALVIGRLMKNKDAQSQKMRWEHGHIEMIFVEVPRLLRAFFRQGRFELLVLALDILIPPLSLLVIIWLGETIMTFAAMAMGISSLPAIITAIAGGFILAAVLLSWWQYGRSHLSFISLRGIPFYILSKIPIYLKFLFQPQKRWLQTERDLTLLSTEKTTPRC